MVFGKFVDGATRSLDLLLRRHALLAQNLAHLDTPGYRARDLDFAGALEAAFAGAPADGWVVEVQAPPGVDGNTVDLDRESTKMAENSLRYDAVTRVLAHRLALLKYVVTEGGNR